MKRVSDLFFSLCLIPVLVFPVLIIAALVKVTSRGPVLYWSDRIGVNNRIFKMPKFRTMSLDTPPVATHLLGNPEKYLTPIGPFLRKLSLDELPNPVKGEYDEYYLKNRSFLLDLKILWMTFLKVVKCEGVTH